MFIERKEDLSIYYWLKDLFSSVPYVKIVDEFPFEELTIPTVSIDVGEINMEDFELGNEEGLRARQWYVDVFAKTKTQREDFGYLILNELKNAIPVYDYDEGFPPDTTPSIINHLIVRSRRYEPVTILPELVDKMYYRVTISFVATQNKV